MKTFIVYVALFLFPTAALYAQDIEAQLSGNTATQGFTVKSYAGTPLFTVRGDGKIGLGILNPDALLHVAGQVKITGGSPGAGKLLTSDANGLASWAASAVGSLDQAYDFGGPGAGRIITADAGAVLIAGVDGFFASAGGTSQGTIPTSGAGARMMWYPRKRAFRAGYVNGTEWDDANIGNYSIAMGNGTTASGGFSTAMGSATIASGNVSTAMGSNATASGSSSTAMGFETTASGDRSTAMGSYANTGGYTGSMAIGDASTTTDLTNTAANQWRVRFAGGIGFYTNAAKTTGAYMNGGTSGWTNYCDRTRKENFTAIDGEALLARLSAVPVFEWNYKGTESSVRYIGPMAQDFWQAFHLGGTDSLGINSISIDGVNMAAIQALEKRTVELTEKTAELSEKTAELQQKTDEIALLKEKVATLENAQAQYAAQAFEIRQLRKDLAELKALLTEKSPAGNEKHASLDPGN